MMRLNNIAVPALNAIPWTTNDFVTYPLYGFPLPEPVNGRRMTDSHDINRLVDWIVSQSDSKTAAEMISGDLEYLGRRLDAADEAGHKAAHDQVDRFDAARFLTGTYLILGDVLRLAGGASPAHGESLQVDGHAEDVGDEGAEQPSTEA